ncbi:lactonase family protein [Pararobbsia silviterrae]|uniref:Lactonase family protein n=1 Tax=Pararobbsia silviterrae TaxID=1792498 RepID=A0A494YD10_9BURK|nr:lactonase family protein [Pararobbsia silviterrae]RKP57894.1 lactonase family protein [Pararobbsia silviterrae]
MQSSSKEVFSRYVHIAALGALAVSAWLYATLSCAQTPATPAVPGVLPTSAASATPAQSEWVYVGTQQAQIHALRLDTSTGALTTIGPVAEGLKATWVAVHPERPIVYSVDDDNVKEGSITAFAVDRATGALTRIDQTASAGNGTTNLSFDAPSMTLLAANYASGSVSSVAVNADGSVGPRVSTIAETGSGPNKRQASAHAHSVVVDPSGRYALVPDFGADRVFIYDFDRATHTLTSRAAPGQDDPRAFVAPPGTGPRHLVFGASGQYVYLLTELSAEVIVLRWDAAHARLTPVQTLPVSTPAFNGVKSAAEIALSRDGRFVYVEDRAENAIVVLSVDPASGTLSPVQRIGSGGDRPWGFAIDPSGQWLLVANQRSGSVNVFRIDPASGVLTDTGAVAQVPTAVAITFVR